MLPAMLAVLRPALAVLLLVGAGVAVVDAACCDDVAKGCAFVEADDDDLRIGGVAAIVPTPPTLTRAEQPPLRLEAQPPRHAARAADVLTDAPKTSPPA